MSTQQSTSTTQGTLFEQPDRPASVPFARGSATSRAAADSIRHALVGLELKVYGAFLEAGADGLTTDKCEEITGLSHQTCSARVNGLANPDRKGGPLLMLSDVQRKTRSGRNAGVYVAVKP